jgi:cellulose biosynthesis protein BcsQ
MEEAESRRVKARGSEGELAKDVARLYSWANVEEADYRDFSRERNLPSSLVPKPLPSNAQPPTIEATTPTTPSRAAEMRMHAEATGTGLAASTKDVRPSLAVYSIAGGVGKTTLCANVGRILCSLGEQILLVDASNRGLLPLYFGASEPRPGLRTFVAPEANCPPLQVIGTEYATAEWLHSEVVPAMLSARRTIFDVGSPSPDLLAAIFGMCTVALIPLLPDLNSVLTVSRIETSLKGMQSAEKQTPVAYYVFNQFDERRSNDQQTRDLVVRHCGDRLLPMAIGCGPMVRALDARVTVSDYEPGSEAAGNYLELALWLRRIAPAAAPAFPLGRWTER